MNSTERLITAMHVVIPDHFASCGAWIERAQQHHGLLEALHVVFGKRLPTPNKLGLWLSEHCGQSAGELTLRGRHSLRRKGWVYGVWSKVALEPPAPVAAPPPAPDTMLVPTPDGQSIQRVAYTTAVRDGQVVKVPGVAPVRDYVLPPAPPVAPKPAPTRWVAAYQNAEGAWCYDGTPSDAPTESPGKICMTLAEYETRSRAFEARNDDDGSLPPWTRRGEKQARDKAEWLAWQQRRALPPVANEVSAPDPRRHGNGVFEVPASNGVRLSYEDPRGGWRSVGTLPNPNWRQNL